MFDRCSLDQFRYKISPERERRGDARQAGGRRKIVATDLVPKEFRDWNAPSGVICGWVDGRKVGRHEDERITGEVKVAIWRDAQDPCNLSLVGEAEELRGHGNASYISPSCYHNSSQYLFSHLF